MTTTNSIILSRHSLSTFTPLLSAPFQRICKVHRIREKQSPGGDPASRINQWDIFPNALALICPLRNFLQIYETRRSRGGWWAKPVVGFGAVAKKPSRRVRVHDWVMVPLSLNKTPRPRRPCSRVPLSLHPPYERHPRASRNISKNTWRAGRRRRRRFAGQLTSFVFYHHACWLCRRLSCTMGDTRRNTIIPMW